MLVLMLDWDVGGRDPFGSDLLLWPYRFLGCKLGPCLTKGKKYDYDCQGKEFMSIGYHWFKNFYLYGIRFRFWETKKFLIIRK
jgi:hypothetical protein